MKYVIIVVLLFWGCSGQKETTPNLRSEYLKDNVHRKYIAVGEEGPMQDIFTLMINETPDEYHKLNPDLILKTDLKKGRNSSYMTSRNTGIVYVCVFEKGDTIIIPNWNTDIFELED